MSAWAQLEAVKNKWVPGNPAMAQQARDAALRIASLVKQASRRKINNELAVAENMARSRGIDPSIVGLDFVDSNYQVQPKQYGAPRLPDTTRPAVPGGAGRVSGPPSAATPAAGPDDSTFLDALTKILNSQ
jgi:hypothetical protein